MNDFLRLAVLMTALALLLAAQNLHAQTAPRSPWIFSFDVGGLHQSEADLKDREGDFAVDRWFARAGVDYAWDRRHSLGVSVGGGSSDYTFGDLSGSQAPWGKVEDFRLALTGRFAISDTGTAMIIPTVRLNGEEGASSSDSDTLGLFAAAFWRVSDTLSIGPGLGVFSQLKGGTRVFPILAIDWDIGERWKLSTGRGLAASQGPGLTLSYRLNPAWSFGLAGRYERIEFRLNDEGPAPDGVGRDESLPLVLSATLEPNPMLTLSAFGGIEFGGRLKLYDDQDELIEESDYDPAAIFGVTLAFRF